MTGAVCRWEALGGRRVLLGASVVQGLRARAIEALLALPRRGLEIGGLLYGHVEPEALRIEAFQEVPCEHRYGPSYALSEADLQRFSELLDQHAHTGTTPVAGLFRSFTGREPQIAVDDEKFVRSHYPRGEFLLLLLQPLSHEKCMAQIRFFVDGELLPEARPIPFVFDAAHMEAVAESPVLPETPVVAESALNAAAEPPIAEPAPPAVEPPAFEPHAFEPPPLPPSYRALEAARQEPPPESEPAPRHLDVPAFAAAEHPRRARWWLPLAICLAAAAIGAAGYEVWSLASQPRWVELHLDARPAGREIRVTWDGNAAHASGAARALLAMTDGGERHDIELSPAQLSAGAYTYSPQHESLAIRLILYAKGVGVTGDAVRLAVVPAPAESAGATVPAPAAEASAPAATPPAAAPPAPEPAPERPITPPRLLHEVQPSIPVGIRARIEEEIVIPVRLHVNERGRVTRASAERSDSDGLHRYLADQAEKAARRWRFRPARSEKGTPVESAKTVEFVFRK